MPEYRKPIGKFLLQARRHLKKLVPDVVAKNPYVGWSLFGASALAPIVGYEAQRRAKPVPADEPDIANAKAAVAAALGKQSDLTSVLASEVAEQTLIRGLDNMRRSVRAAKGGGLPGLPELPASGADKPKAGFVTRSQEESREEGDTIPDSDRPAASRKRMV